ncbi:MAG: fibronectin type III domain-containing protein, partial [Armatimonadota bacterium]
RLDPAPGHSGHFDIDYIRLVPDITPPAGSISINGGAAYTTNRIANLTLSSSDDLSGVSKMRFSNDGAIWIAWEDYSSAKQWSLAEGFGIRTVSVQFRDKHMNRSRIYASSITLESIPPTGTIDINSGAAYTNSPGVTLNLSAQSSVSTVTEMRLANSDTTWNDWEPYTATRYWSMSAVDGTKSVYVLFKDAFGTISASANDAIILDTVAPAGLISINSGAAYTTSSDVMVTSSVTDNLSGISDMRFVNSNGTWSAWESFAAVKSWALQSGEGLRTVYGRFTDRAGNTAPLLMDTITVDYSSPTAPGVPSDAGAYTNSTNVVFNWDAATDLRSGIDNYTCQIGTAPGLADVFDGSVASALTKTITGSFGSRYWCRVQARDKAGNIGPWSASSDGITIVQNPGVAIGSAKSLADQATAGVSSKVVTAVFGDRFYVQELKRASGIMIKPIGGMPAQLAVGKLVDACGTLNTDTNGERWISATVSVLTDSASVKPLSMSNVRLGGEAWNYSALQSTGQRGITGADGLNNLGLLIRTTGVVLPIDPISFGIDDGSGVGVIVALPSGVQAPPAGSLVFVNGISSCYPNGVGLQRRVLVRDAADIVVVPGAQ